MMQGGDKWNNGKLWSNDKLDRAIKKAWEGEGGEEESRKGFG
jgi:hypothetical protein